MTRTCLYAGVFASVLAGSAIAADALNDAAGVKWQAAPPFLPKGADFAVVSGDPAKEGPYIIRLKVPASYKMPAHSHPRTENVTVMSGDLHVGMGDKLDPSKGQSLQAGGFIEAPARMNHYAWSDGGAVLQVHGDGPFEITYTDPADDPRTK